MKRSQHRVLPACCRLRSVVGFSDSLLLPPAGEGIAGKRGFLLQRADVGLVQLVFSFFQLPVGLELVGTVGMLRKACCLFRSFLSMMGRFYAGIFLFHFADLTVDFRQGQVRYAHGMRRGRRLRLLFQMQAQPGFSGGFVCGAGDGDGFLFRNICPIFFYPGVGFFYLCFRFFF